MGLASAEVAKTVKDKRQEALTLPAALVEQTQMMPLPKNKHDCVADRVRTPTPPHNTPPSRLPLLFRSHYLLQIALQGVLSINSLNAVEAQEVGRDP